MRTQFTKTMMDLGMDEKVVLLVGDIGVWGLRHFKEKYPARFYNIGICEQSMMSLSAGLALAGLIPIVHSITPFVTERCFEQIKDDFCYQGLGGNIVSVGSCFDYAGLGCTHHCYSEIAAIRALPRTQIIYPASEIEFDLLMKQTYNNNKLTYFRLPQKKHSYKFTQDQIKFGKGIKINEGKDITLVVVGPQLENTLKARIELEKEGILPEIIYIHTIKPLDDELISASAKKTKNVLTIEEHNILGGLADEVSRNLEGTKDITLSRMGVNDEFITNYGTYDEICESIGLTSHGIIRKVKEMLDE
ncbi:MAG: transketolase C-terminal domain-containing protein [Nanoarchaeota archaeon]